MNKTLRSGCLLIPKGKLFPTFLAACVFSHPSILPAQSSTVAHWKELNAGSINSDMDTASPIIGDGTANNADNAWIAGRFGTVASPESVTLSVGETLTVSGKVFLTGGTGSVDQFRFGVFDDGGQFDVGGTTWSNGGWLYRAGGDIFQANTNGVFVSTNPNAVALSTSSSNTGGGWTASSSLAYDWSFSISRVSATTIDLSASLTGGDNGVDLTATVSGLTTSSFTYTAVGILFGGGMDLDQGALSNVTYTLTGPPVIPTGNVTFIDADNAASTGNTVLEGAGSFGSASSTIAVDDGLWSVRTTSGVNGGGVLATAAAENAQPRLATTFTLPGPGLYAIYGYFWNNSDGDGFWDAEFQLGSVRPSKSWTKSNATSLAESTGRFTDASVSVNDGTGQILFEAPLGVWNTETEGLTVKVYTDDPMLGGVSDERTWFDGVGRALTTIDLTPGADFDSDGLDNVSEVSIHGTDPSLADTDGDGRSDGQEVTDGTDPLVPDDAPPPPLEPGLPGEAVLIQTDGAWTWFNDHTARFVGGDLYVGYVKNGPAKMSMTRHDFDTGTSYEFLLGTQSSRDDHDVPTVNVLPDGRILSTYSRHNPDAGFYARTALNANPTSLADWSSERFVGTGGSNSYSNCFRLSGESETLYHFSRAINYNPTLVRSMDNGQTWSTPMRFIRTGTGGVRPYPRYATDHESRIDLIYTDGHPRNENNSIYHLYYQDGKVHQTDGTMLKSFADLPVLHDSGERGTRIYSYSSAAWGAGEGPDDWIPSGRAWTWDIQYDKAGHPVCVFQVQVDNVTGTGWNHDRIYYYYARWNGSEWQRRFIAQGGRGLYSSEDDYGGGMTLDPENPNVVYLSSNAEDPFDLATLAPSLNPNNERYEIYRGVTEDGGATWTWEAITSGSDADNLRPFVPEDHGRARALVWFRGIYRSYTNFSCDVYGYFVGAGEVGLGMKNLRLSPDGGYLKWASEPGVSYKVTASTDLSDFPIDIATGIISQGDSTQHTFTHPPEISGSPAAFLRIEEE